MLTIGSYCVAAAAVVEVTSACDVNDLKCVNAAAAAVDSCAACDGHYAHDADVNLMAVVSMK